MYLEKILGSKFWAIHSKCRWNNGEFNSKAHLQTFKRYLIYIHKTYVVPYVFSYTCICRMLNSHFTDWKSYLLLVFKINENQMKPKSSQQNVFYPNIKQKISISVSGLWNILKRTGDNPKITCITYRFIIFISWKVWWFKKYIFGTTICNIIFPHQLGAEKSELGQGLGNPGSIFCCISSKQNNNPFHNLYGCKFLKITFKISSQFCLPTSSHNNIEFDGCKINLEIQLHQTYANIFHQVLYHHLKT